jgi:LemA protein
MSRLDYRPIVVVFTRLIALVSIVVLALVILGLAVWLVSVYNGLVQLRNNNGKAWSNLDVLLQQRHDELTKLVDAASGYMKHERGALEEVTRLRGGYDAAEDSEKKVRIENELNQAFGRVRVTWEAYPDLKANQDVMLLMQRISALESEIADRREFFNDSVTVYNTTIERFPDLLAAGAFGYFRRDLLVVPEELKQDVKVDLS